MPYRWNSPNDWLTDIAYDPDYREEHLREILRRLARCLDPDTIQDQLQEEMEADGYFEDGKAYSHDDRGGGLMITIERSGNGFKIKFSEPGTGTRGYSIQAKDSEVFAAIDHYYGIAGKPHYTCPVCKRIAKEEMRES